MKLRGAFALAQGQTRGMLDAVMASHAQQSHLRLIREHPLRMEAWRREQVAREQVAVENRSAAAPGLEPNDPRWVVAVRTQSMLQGSTLTPERRERLLRTAKQLGVRTFDASVIIAIVQDQARRGETIGSAQALLSMVPRPIGPARSAWVRWVGATVLAAVANLILIWWLLRGH